MQVLLAFIVGVIVGVIVYIISLEVPFLAGYAGLLGILSFLLAAFLTYTGNRRI